MVPSSSLAAFVEAERRVPRLELVGGREEADDLAVLGVGGHPVPGLGGEARRIGFDDRMDPLGHGAIRVRHLGDLRELGLLVFRLARGRLQLLGALLHRVPFLGRELLVGRWSVLADLVFCVSAIFGFLAA